jgi:hypothetical protein
MNTDKLLKEIEDALVSACKYTDETHGRILMTKARAKTIIADIRAARSQGRKVSKQISTKSLIKLEFEMYGIE